MQDTVQKIDVGIARQSLESLHDHVVGKNKRIVISKAGSDECAVLISQTELTSLEHALEILSNTDEGVAMRDRVLRVIDQATAMQSPTITPLA
jgi:PHD/YefM family antitoxin component YafN of YafNO toxin-antitoxin module